MRCIIWLIHPLGNVIPLVFHTFRPESVKYNPFLSAEYVFTLLQAKLDHFFITELITEAITWEFCSTKVDKNIPTKH